MRIIYYDRKMPYLFNYKGIPAGGAAKEFFSWNIGFKETIHKFSVLTWKGAKEYINKDIDMELIESYDPQKGIPKLRRFYYRIPALYNTLRRYNPDVIIQSCCNFDTGVFGLISFLLRKKFVYRVANDDEADGRYKNRIRIIDRISYKIGILLSNSILCQNNYQLTNFKKKYPNKNIFILNVPLGAKIDEVSEIKKENYIAWVAIFQKQKNMPALQHIAENCPNTKFKIAGGKQDVLDEETKNAIEGLKKLNNVEFVGFLKQTEVYEFLGKAKALLNTSHYEGFSLTFLESWSVGTPIITTVNVNPDNIISNFNLGFVGKDYNSVVDFINNNINNNNFKSYSERCKEYIKEHHNPKAIVNRFLQKVL